MTTRLAEAEARERKLREALESIADGRPLFDYVELEPGEPLDLATAKPGSPYDRGKAEGFRLQAEVARAALTNTTSTSSEPNDKPALGPFSTLEEAQLHSQRRMTIVQIRDMYFPSVVDAAKYFNMSPNTVTRAISAGRADNIGKKKIKGTA